MIFFHFLVILSLLSWLRPQSGVRYSYTLRQSIGVYVSLEDHSQKHSSHDHHIWFTWGSRGIL